MPRAVDLSQEYLLERQLDPRFRHVPVRHTSAQEGEEAQDGEREEEDGVKPLPEGVHGAGRKLSTARRGLSAAASVY